MKNKKEKEIGRFENEKIAQLKPTRFFSFFLFSFSFLLGVGVVSQNYRFWFQNEKSKYKLIFRDSTDKITIAN